MWVPAFGWQNTCPLFFVYFGSNLLSRDDTSAEDNSSVSQVSGHMHIIMIV